VTHLRLRYVHAFIDRHGRVRHYFRRHGRRLPLPGLPGSAEFNRAYEQALAGAPPVAAIGAARTVAGSVNAMVVGYLGSAAFHNLAPASQQQYRRILEGIRREHGDKSMAKLERRHVVLMLDGKVEHPAAARDFLRCLRLLVQHAIKLGIRQDDPTQGVRVKMPKTGGFHTWTDEEIAAFEAAYPLGTKQRLALALLLNTAARCADVVKLGRGHLRNGSLSLSQQKTRIGKPPLTIPVTSELADAINAAALSEHVVFLVNERGGAFTAKGFGKWFTKQCRRASLLGCSAHGLRKASCRRLAEAGCSASEIAAISGHRSLREVQRYVEAADQAKMARNAMARIKAATSIGKPSH
jgi:integrase